MPHGTETFGYEQGAYPEHYDLFVVCDGHNGTMAGEFFVQHIQEAVASRVPKGPPPPLGTREASQWMAAMRGAAADAILHLEEQFARVAQSSGCTVSVVMLVGRWCMVANVGDSSVVMDSGHRIEQLNVDHRLEDNVREQERVITSGGLLTRLDEGGWGPCLDDEGYGPLRVWPGGLALSRAFGDFDVGEFIFASPYIQQTMLPETGARICLASDGVWDGYTNNDDVMRAIRKYGVEKAATKCVMGAIRRRGLMDDTSAIVIDVLPSDGRYTFPQLCGHSLWSCMCVKRDVFDEEGSVAGSTRASAIVLHSVDTGVRGDGGDPGTSRFGSSHHRRMEVLRAVYSTATKDDARAPAARPAGAPGPGGDVSVYGGNALGLLGGAGGQGGAGGPRPPGTPAKAPFPGQDVSVYAGQQGIPTRATEGSKRGGQSALTEDERFKRLAEIHEALKAVKLKGAQITGGKREHRKSIEVHIDPAGVGSVHGPRFDHDLFKGAVPMVVTPEMSGEGSSGNAGGGGARDGEGGAPGTDKAGDKEADGGLVARFLKM